MKRLIATLALGAILIGCGRQTPAEKAISQLRNIKGPCNNYSLEAAECISEYVEIMNTSEIETILPQDPCAGISELHELAIQEDLTGPGMETLEDTCKYCAQGAEGNDSYFINSIISKQKHSRFDTGNHKSIF